MSSLRDHLSAKKPEAQNPSASFHEAQRAVALVVFRLDGITRHGFPPAQLCRCTLILNPDANREALPERLTLAFATADVFVYGARLASLLPPLAEHTLAWVAKVDPRYAHADDRAWVGDIVLAPSGPLDASPPVAPVAPRGPVTTTLARPDEGNNALPPEPRPSGSRPVRP